MYVIQAQFLKDADLCRLELQNGNKNALSKFDLPKNLL